VKANFLRRFIPNYAELTLRFTQLVKKCSKFVWDTTANKYFDSLKLTLTHTPLLFPLDYSQDYFLYLAASDSAIDMVLVQEDDFHDEHVIYYLIQSLTTTETKYLHVEKLALGRRPSYSTFPTLYPFTQDYFYFQLQPSATHSYTPIARGKILQMIIILQMNHNLNALSPRNPWCFPN
jgi:hypothetical protein